MLNACPCTTSYSKVKHQASDNAARLYDIQTGQAPQQVDALVKVVKWLETPQGRIIASSRDNAIRVPSLPPMQDMAFLPSYKVIIKGKNNCDFV